MVSQFPIKFPVLVLVGPTAIGKTRLSLKLARQFDCEIVSLDSMQVYRYMDIGTAKITQDEMGSIPHHLIDVVDPDENYDAGRYVKEALTAIVSIIKRGKTPLVTGGTGLYLKSLIEGLAETIPTESSIREKLQMRLAQEGSSDLLEELYGYDPVTAERIHKNDHQRLVRAVEIYLLTGIPWSQHLIDQKKNQLPRFSSLFQIGLTCDRHLLYERIDARTLQMKEQGLEEEVRGLLDRGYHFDLNPMKALGYKHMGNYLRGEWTHDESFHLLARDTRHYAKRQYTWFSKHSSIQWFDISCEDVVIDKVDLWISATNSNDPTIHI